MEQIESMAAAEHEVGTQFDLTPSPSLGYTLRSVRITKSDLPRIVPDQDLRSLVKRKIANPDQSVPFSNEGEASGAKSNSDSNESSSPSASSIGSGSMEVHEMFDSISVELLSGLRKDTLEKICKEKGINIDKGNKQEVAQKIYDSDAEKLKAAQASSSASASSSSSSSSLSKGAAGRRGSSSTSSSLTEEPVGTDAATRDGESSPSTPADIDYGCFLLDFETNSLILGPDMALQVSIRAFDKNLNPLKDSKDKDLKYSSNIQIKQPLNDAATKKSNYTKELNDKSSTMERCWSGGR